MPRVNLIIWLLMLGLATGHLAAALATGTAPCCQPESDNACCTMEQSAAVEASPADASTASEGSCCCPAPSTDDNSQPAPADDAPHDHQPCKCPLKCCVAGKAPVTFVTFPLSARGDQPAARTATDRPEPLPNATLDRLKRPPRHRANA